MAERPFAIGESVLRRGTFGPVMEIKRIGREMPGAAQTLLCEWWTDGILRTDLLANDQVELAVEATAPLL